MRNNPLKYTDPSGMKTEIVVRFAHSGLDAGHSMISINGIAYGWHTEGFKLYMVRAKMHKFNLADKISNSPGHFGNSDYMFFEMNIDEDQEVDLQNNLDAIEKTHHFITMEYTLSQIIVQLQQKILLSSTLEMFSTRT